VPAGAQARSHLDRPDPLDDPLFEVPAQQSGTRAGKRVQDGATKRGLVYRLELSGAQRLKCGCVHLEIAQYRKHSFPSRGSAELEPQEHGQGGFGRHSIGNAAEHQPFPAAQPACAQDDAITLLGGCGLQNRPRHIPGGQRPFVGDARHRGTRLGPGEQIFALGRRRVFPGLRPSTINVQDTELKRLELTVYTDNAPAIALYEAMGFEREGLLRRYAFRGGTLIDALTMARLV